MRHTDAELYEYWQMEASLRQLWLLTGTEASRTAYLRMKAESEAFARGWRRECEADIARLHAENRANGLEAYDYPQALTHTYLDEEDE